MDGKEKCKALKQIRKQIADNNDIEYVVDECKHKGKCKGTCPKCEAELRYLERELEKKRSIGQKVAVAGVSLGIAASFSACTPTDVVNSLTYPIRDVFGLDSLGNPGTPDYSGDVSIDPGYDLQGEEVDPGYDIMGEVAAPVDDGCEDGCDDGIGDLEGERMPEEEEYELDGDVEYIPIDEDYELEGGAVYDPDEDI